MACLRNIKDRKPGHPDVSWTINDVATVIRSAMAHGPDHPRYGTAIVDSPGATDSTHFLTQLLN
jgi:hypothetical protein